MKKLVLSFLLALTILWSLLPVSIAAGADSDFVIEGTMLMKYTGSGGNVVIPDGVTAIGDGAFRGRTNVINITIPDGVTEIGDSAFRGCVGLTDIIIPDSATKIGDYALWGCTSITDITIPQNVTVIGSYAFGRCTGLTSIMLPNSITEISHGAIMDCSGLLTITIPNGVTKIDDFAFDGCSSLASVTIPDGVTEIGGYAFSKCNLTDIMIPDSVTKIGSGAFSNCTGLTNVMGCKNVASIGYYAFSGCAKLISFPDFTQLKEIGEFAFPSNAIGKILNRSQRQVLYEYTRTKWVNLGKNIIGQSEKIVALSNEITIGAKTDYEKAKAVYNWMQKNISYDHSYVNGRKNTVTLAPEDVIDSRLTVCEGYSRLTRALLQAQGIPALLVSGLSDGDTDGNWVGHVWNEAFIDGRWVIMDTTWSRGWTSNTSWVAQPKYFDMSIANFAEDHLVEGYPAATADDTPSDWARNEVWDAMVGGLIPNDLQSAYRNNITREEFCRLMVTLVEQESGQEISDYLNIQELSIDAPFTDTDSEAVLAAYALGIVNGVSEDTFNPDGSITRQEAAVMLSRTAKVLGLTAEEGETFADEATFASWAVEGISFVSGLTDSINGNKVMGGTGEGYFSPLASYSREQAYLTVLRLFRCSQ